MVINQKHLLTRQKSSDDFKVSKAFHSNLNKQTYAW